MTENLTLTTLGSGVMLGLNAPPPLPLHTYLSRNLWSLEFSVHKIYVSIRRPRMPYEEASR